MTRQTPEVRDSEDLVVLSEEDINQIATDMYVDIREATDDRTAAVAVEVIHERLTDPFYYE